MGEGELRTWPEIMPTSFTIDPKRIVNQNLEESVIYSQYLWISPLGTVLFSVTLKCLAWGHRHIYEVANSFRSMRGCSLFFLLSRMQRLHAESQVFQLPIVFLSSVDSVLFDLFLLLTFHLSINCTS